METDFKNKIKELRQKNNMTQKELAEKLNVTYQAVSKWETGKNLPDLLIMKQISELFNIDINELMNIQNKKENKNRKIIYILITIIILITITFTIYIIMKHKNNESDFQMKTVSTSCENFNLSGAIAYNKNKTSIHISEINYCGINEDKKYEKITCELYEKHEEKETIITTCQEKNNTTLNDFLKEQHFNVDNYERSCKIYTENSLYIKISLKSSNEETTIYTIPLTLKDNCKN